MKIRKNKKGFTIVELVIVIGVIGILSAILIPTFVNVTKNAEDARTRSNLANAYSAYAAEAADGYIDGTDHAILFYSQEKIGLAKASDEASNFYQYGSNGWNLTATAKPTSTTPTLVTSVASEALYGGYYFFYFAA